MDDLPDDKPSFVAKHSFVLPNEIICLILTYLDNLDLTRYRRVSNKWKNMIETKILYNPIQLSIEDCILTLNYYQFLKYTKIKITDNQKLLIKIINNKFFVNNFKLDYSSDEMENKRNYMTNLLKDYVNKGNLLKDYVNKGNLPVVKFLLENNICDISTYNDPFLVEKNPYNRAAMCCVENNKIDLFDYFLEKGADIDEIIILAINRCTVDGYFDFTKHLFEICNRYAINIDMDIFITNCIRFDRFDIFKYLIEEGATIYNNQAFIASAKHGHLEIFNFYLNIIKNSPKNSNLDIHAWNDDALISSASNGYIEIVKLLLDNGANIHAQNEKALRNSLVNGYLDVAKLLLKHGANIHIDDDSIFLNCVNIASEFLGRCLPTDHYFGAKPNCIRHNSFEIVKYLLTPQNLLILNTQTNYDMAFLVASYYGYLELVIYLVQLGADIHVDDDLAMNRCIKYCKKELNGENYNVRNNVDSYRIKGDYFSIIKFLIEKGCKCDDEIILKNI
jgi:hypothetical protein